MKAIIDQMRKIVTEKCDEYGKKDFEKYTIVSYNNDILTAGCHKIAYAEMEHMYNEIIKNEEAAA